MALQLTTVHKIYAVDKTDSSKIMKQFKDKEEFNTKEEALKYLNDELLDYNKKNFEFNILETIKFIKDEINRGTNS